MENNNNLKAIVIEKNQGIIDLLLPILKNRSCRIKLSPGKADAVRNLKEEYYGLAFIGNTDDNVSPFDAMKDIVMVSPMTSIILITDLPTKDVHEKAEGYGILGHVSSKVSSEKLIPLLDQFERINKSLS